MKFLILLTLLTSFVSCSSFQASRDNAKDSDEKAMEVTDKWLAEDTRRAIKEVLKQMETHRGFKKFLARHRGEPKVFIGDVQNRTDEAYFPIADFNDEFLYELSKGGEFRLVDAAARDQILEEITYQNDGMVDPAQAKQIGKQLGADLMIFGAIHMQTQKRDGKAVKQYSVNLRMTNVETAEEVLRVRTRVFKSSTKSAFGF